MKRIPISLILILVTLGLFAQDANIVNQSIDFIRMTFIIAEQNPMEKPESDRINSIFQSSIQEYCKKTNKAANNDKILDIFNILYENGGAIYTDSQEERRMKLRRAACFASIALLSDNDKGFTFIQYAKFALSENINAPNVKFIEEQYLGLLFIEMTFKYDDGQLNQIDLKDILKYINLYKKNMDKVIIDKATSLLNRIEQEI